MGDQMPPSMYPPSAAQQSRMNQPGYMREFIPPPEAGSLSEYQREQNYYMR